MITFVLNNQIVHTDKAEGTALLDFIRDDSSLPGTKIGCREGDCGACTVLEGTLKDGRVLYKSIVSCLTPLGNAHGKHIVTLEGINMNDLTPVQKAMVDNAATQCGFCTPGFIMSFTAHAMSHQKVNAKGAIDAVSGNICRCTGYKSIERAAQANAEAMQNKDLKEPVKWLVEKHYLPDYFLKIPKMLREIESPDIEFDENHKIMGGGTDLLVQQHDKIAESPINRFYLKDDLKQITVANNRVIIGAGCTANDIALSELMQDFFPKIKEQFKLISSEPIRNTATVAGNIMNASPIGDLSIFFLALNASVILNNKKQQREMPLKEFFLDYKKTAIEQGEFIEAIAFQKPEKGVLVNYEKVSKRTHLDIASVTSAMKIIVEKGIIEACSISAGGVKAIPLFLNKTSEFLTGKNLTPEVIQKANEIMQTEIAPISDVRGKSEYKRLLLKQILFAHFMELFPGHVAKEGLLR
ncbi:Isoquinoline 1-oxidoreductase subunit alpha [Salinivirga cyanobacteriivorans]|uniref:Isoquinoline 1-oxidoreductase subunit alpha n=1 Tax=Salinivirga cyanobacteriivorans TaxID=1307839 RepID=A0A0S2I257_9BACT|nr:FAD binding domain-containing protein [Salinivirga cyanobacteriivorans]ALO16340.1 Isoquinoline 1-oxidoreductase subunit alpha [Salinivirga cyanobacteriivorans]